MNLKTYIASVDDSIYEVVTTTKAKAMIMLEEIFKHPIMPHKVSLKGKATQTEIDAMKNNPCTKHESKKIGNRKSGK